MSCNATELLENEAGRQIPAPSATRQNSTYAMIEAMVSIENAHVGLLSRAAEETAPPCASQLKTVQH